MFGLVVVVLLAVFATVALPQIVSDLSTTQSTATGITAPLDLAMTQFPYILSIGTLVIIAMIVVIGMRR